MPLYTTLKTRADVSPWSTLTTLVKKEGCEFVMLSRYVISACDILHQVNLRPITFLFFASIHIQSEQPHRELQ